MNERTREETAPRGRQTLILTRETIAATMSFEDYVLSVEIAFAAHARGRIDVPEVVHIPAREGAFHVKSAAMSDGPEVVAVKVNGNFPGNTARNGLPTIQGAILLCDRSNGSPLAILDSMEITAQRTAAATAVAAKYLAKRDATTATIVGCGVQASVQLQGLLHVRPIGRVFVYDLDRERATRFAEREGAAYHIPVEVVPDFSTGTRESDIVVTCTSAREAFLRPEHVRVGSFIAAVGADNHDKQEIHPLVLKKSRLVVDVLEQCAQIGDLHHALVAGVLTRSDVHAELGQVVTGAKAGRTSKDEIIVFDSTGSAFQDVAAAAVVFERARLRGEGSAITLS